MMVSPNPGKRTATDPRTLALSALIGPVLWAMHFTIVYGIHGFLCSQASASPSALRAAIFLATAIVIATQSYMTWTAWAFARRTGTDGLQPFIGMAALLLNLLSLVAVAWVGGAAFIIPECIGIR